MLKILTEKDNEDINDYIEHKIARKFIDACEIGDIATVKYIYEHIDDDSSKITGKYINKSLNPALTKACKHDKLEIAELLISYGANVSYDNNKPFKSAIKHLRMLKFLYKFSIIDVTVENFYVLRKAVIKGYVEQFKYLVSLPQFINNVAFDNNYLMRKAAEFGRLEIIEILMLCKGVNPAVNNNYPFITACANGHDKVVAYLLRFPVVNSKDKDHFVTGLNLASEHGHVAVVKVLLQHMKITDNTCINNAVDYDHIEIVILLLPFVTPDESSLRIAVADGYLEIIELLLPKMHPDLDRLIDVANKYNQYGIADYLYQYKLKCREKMNFFERMFS